MTAPDGRHESNLANLIAALDRKLLELTRELQQAVQMCNLHQVSGGSCSCGRQLPCPQLPTLERHHAARAAALDEVNKERAAMAAELEQLLRERAEALALLNAPTAVFPIVQPNNQIPADTGINQLATDHRKGRRLRGMLGWKPRHRRQSGPSAEAHA